MLSDRVRVCLVVKRIYASVWSCLYSFIVMNRYLQSNGCPGSRTASRATRRPASNRYRASGRGRSHTRLRNGRACSRTRTFSRVVDVDGIDNFIRTPRDAPVRAADAVARAVRGDHDAGAAAAQ